MINIVRRIYFCQPMAKSKSGVTKRVKTIKWNICMYENLVQMGAFGKIVTNKNVDNAKTLFDETSVKIIVLYTTHLGRPGETFVKSTRTVRVCAAVSSHKNNGQTCTLLGVSGGWSIYIYICMYIGSQTERKHTTHGRKLYRLTGSGGDV